MVTTEQHYLLDDVQLQLVPLLAWLTGETDPMTVGATVLAPACATVPRCVGTQRRTSRTRYSPL